MLTVDRAPFADVLSADGELTLVWIDLSEEEILTNQGTVFVSTDQSESGKDAFQSILVCVWRKVFSPSSIFDMPSSSVLI